MSGEEEGDVSDHSSPLNAEQFCSEIRTRGPGKNTSNIRDLVVVVGDCQPICTPGSGAGSGQLSPSLTTKFLRTH